MSTETSPGNGNAAVSAGGCGSCSQHQVADLERLGAELGTCELLVALAGNPNTGKSTVFNALTGLRQHVGNWSGTTVARAEGAFRFEGRSFTVVDLPGAYSLLSSSREEDVARDFLLFGDPDVTVVVVDATRVERTLNLVLQVLQLTDRVVVALNLMDEARRHRIEVDVRHMTRALGVPVVPMAARRGQGVPELLSRISEAASAPGRRGGVRKQRFDPAVARAVDELAGLLAAEFPGLAHAQWVAMRLLEGDPGIRRAVGDGSLGQRVRQRTTRVA